MDKLWQRIERWIAANTDGDLALRPGAPESEIAAFEAQLGRRLPEDLRASYLIHDGQDMPSVRWFDGERRLHPLASIAKEWADGYADETEDPDGPAEDPRAMHIMQHRDRVPLIGVQYWDGDNVYCDFLPGPKGREGQLLYRMDIELGVIASSWREFLEEYARKLEAGELIYTKGVDMYPEANGGIVHADGKHGDILSGFGAGIGSEAPGDE